MTIRTLGHTSASSLAEASELACTSGKTTALVAGGTDLLGTLKDGVHPRYPDLLIDLKPIPDLTGIAVGEDGLVAGALATLAEVAADPRISETWPLLAQAAGTVASPQIRNMATVAGNLCQEPRCWYYRTPENAFHCFRKGGDRCGAILGDNRYHSVFGAVRSGLPGCAQHCPAGVAIPLYLAQLRAGEIEAAVRLILERNPMPAVTGRVCPHDCQSGCGRLGYDEPVAVQAVERTLGDHALAAADRFLQAPERESGRRIAVVGAGPAGLSAAYYLRRAGHAVTVYDREPEPGGMLRYSIPAYRLPKDVLARQIDAYRWMGVTFVPQSELGAELSLRQLRADYDSVFLATGGWQQQRLGLENEGLLGSGLDLLKDVAAGKRELPGERVLVIGGGSVAVDVAITARRLGAHKVTMACLEARQVMPAVPDDIEQALDEGIELLPSWGPLSVLVEDGKLAGMELVRCTSVFDQDGRFKPSFDPATSMTFAADAVLVAIGQEPDLSWVADELPTTRGLLVADPDDQATSVPGVYAGGDLVSGAATVAAAIAAGRRAALAIDAALGGDLALGESSDASATREMNAAAFPPGRAAHAEMGALSERSIDGEDVADLDLNSVQAEAQRCLDCGCVAVNASDLAPALLVLDARIRTTARTLPVAELFAVGTGTTTVLEPGEIVTAVEIPAPPAGSLQAYRKSRVRNSIDFPVVGVATMFTLDGGVFTSARVALGAAAPTPLRATAVEEYLLGRKPSEEAAEVAASLAVSGAKPLAGNAFKLQIVRAFVKEAILAVAEPA